MTQEEFINEIRKIGIDITEDMLNKLELFYNLLIEWNKKINLTRITLKKEVYLKHYYDSLTLYKAIDLNNIETLCDVGTGAGFPGIVLKIFFPNIKVTLIDSLQKRVNYLNDIIEKLGLKDINVLHARGEDFARENREKYDLVVARAVAELRIISEICVPMVKINGLFIAMKSNVTDELGTGEKAINKLGGSIDELKEFDLPNNAGLRTLVVIFKSSITPKIYPRSIDKIKKRTL